MGFQISKREIQDIISCKQLVIENVLKKVYKSIQKYSDNPNNKINLSDEITNETNQRNFNNYAHHNQDNLLINYNNDNIIQGQDNNLRKIIEEKDLKIKELTNIIDVYFK